MTEIERIEELRLRPGDEATIAALLGRCFDTEPGARGRFSQRHHLRLVLRDPGIVGHVALTFRSVRAGERLIAILGLAEVATDPDRRGEGIAGRLVAAAIAEGRASSAEFMALFGDAGIYAAAGFKPVQAPVRAVEMTRARSKPLTDMCRTDLMVLPLRDTGWPEGPVDMLGHAF